MMKLQSFSSVLLLVLMEGERQQIAAAACHGNCDLDDSQ
jgi:hypothetical protein